MTEKPFWPDGDPPAEWAEWDAGGASRLARASLIAPEPSPQAERRSRERALARFQQSLPATRNLQESPKPLGWPERVGRAMRRLLGK